MNPVVVLVGGPPGSGKSTLGRALATRLGAAVIDQDVATNPLMVRIAALTGAGDDLDHPSLGGAVRAARYACLLDIGVDNARIGRSVVLIAPFTSEATDPMAWDGVVRLFRPHEPRLIWTTVPPEVAAERRRRRNLPRDVAAGSSSRPPVVVAVDHLPADGVADPTAEADRIAGLLDFRA